MNEGRLLLVITDNSSRFFKGDILKILGYVEYLKEYYVQRAEGNICGYIKERDVKFLDEV